ncbi:MAG: hypothetical protein V3V18_09510 [Methylococcales bacterium]
MNNSLSKSTAIVCREYLEAVWLKNVHCKALEIVVFFRCSSLNSATIRLEAAKKSNRFKNFSLGHFFNQTTS